MPKKSTIYDLTDEDARGMLDLAKGTCWRDYLILLLIGLGRGFRIGEVLGVVKNNTRYLAWKDPANHALGKEERFSSSHLPGLQAEDIREEAIWVLRKAGPKGLEGERMKVKVPLQPWLYDLISEYAKGRTGKLFDINERAGYDLVQKYARLYGLSDWPLIHPHTWRHYFADLSDRTHNNLRVTQNLLGHHHWQTTMRYLRRRLSPDEVTAKLSELPRPP